MELRLVGSI